jgi:hypothetical protein
MLFNKNPYGVISETPKGLLKRKTKTPMGLFIKPLTRFFNCMKINRK